MSRNNASLALLEISVRYPDYYLQVLANNSAPGASPFERSDHASSQWPRRPHLIFARDEVLPFGCQETDDLIIPGGFTKPFENVSISTRAIVDDEQGHKGILNRFHEQEVCEDVLTERLAAYSSRSN